MNKPEDISIGIIGGGPAGLSAAICLAEKGIDVEVFEKGDWPIDKVCGEGILPIGVEFLESHNILENIGAENYRKFFGIRYIDGRKTAHADFKQGFGLGIRRTALSEGLVKRANEFSNISLNSSCELDSINKFDNTVEILIRRNENLEKYNFDYLISCDGLRSKTRRLLYLDETSSNNIQRIGARVHYQSRPWSDRVEVYWHNGIECYITPVSEELIELAFIWNHEIVKPQNFGGLEEGLKHFFPDIFDRFKDNKKITNLRSIGPLALKSKRAFKDRVILLGDAYFYLDGITGEGISMAFAESEILTDCLMFDKKTFPNNYESRIKSRIKNHIFVTRLALFFSNKPKLRRLAFSILTKNIFSNLLEINMGRKRLIF